VVSLFDPAGHFCHQPHKRIDAGVLSQPLLSLSLFFKHHRSRYYELLDGVRQSGDWEAWTASRCSPASCTRA
jgi:hypothetical protein